MIKKAFLKASFIVPFALLPMGVVLACSNTTNANDKPGDNPGTDNPSDQQPSGSETVAKTNLTAQNFNFNGTVADAVAIINEKWILDNKDKLLDGQTSLFTQTDDIVFNSISFRPQGDGTNEITTGVLTFSLKAGKAFGSNQKPTQEITTFSFTISGFKMPQIMDLEKAKNKFFQFLKEFKYNFYENKASQFQINDLARFGTTNNFGFKTTVQLDKSTNKSDFDDAKGQLFVQVTLTRKPNETETFKHTIDGFLTTAQENAQATDENLKPKEIFNETFSSPDSNIVVVTKDPNANLKNITSKEELLKLVSLEPENEQSKTNAILQKTLPAGYEVRFIEGSIKQKTAWTKTFNEIEAGVQLVNTNTGQASGINKLVITGFAETKTKDVLDEWADFFEFNDSPISAKENDYLNVKASTITTAAQLKNHLKNSTNYEGSLNDRGLTFELDETFNPTDQNDDTGSLKAQFIFKWKNGADANLEVKKVITLYGFQLNS